MAVKSERNLGLWDNYLVKLIPGTDNLTFKVPFQIKRLLYCPETEKVLVMGPDFVRPLDPRSANGLIWGKKSRLPGLMDIEKVSSEYITDSSMILVILETGMKVLCY